MEILRAGVNVGNSSYLSGRIADSPVYKHKRLELHAGMMQDLLLMF